MTIFGLTIDELVKLASLLGGVIVATAAVLAYYDKGTREQKKPFREAQLQLCQDASEAAATLASLTPQVKASPSGPSEGAWENARARFEQLYWGSLAVVENDDVEARMVDFRERLMACENEIRAGTLDEQKRLKLQQDALRIAHACRALIAEGWRLVLPEPTRKSKASELQQEKYAKLKASQSS
jgi:hypothetical protein